MTPDEINEAHELLLAQQELREVGAYLVSHPSCHGSLAVGKLDGAERCIQGGNDILIPHSIAKLAVDTILAALNERLSALGVRDGNG